ncbi:MAG: ribose 5-phosphate isomerase B [Candidatus Aenigmatarchaeota archaeon]|nr:MAG: ribose 5-phosphate isomerase B [Candidatus Aenigmarchaeota archaeon]
MKIAIGSDHAGYELKEKIKAFLKANKYEFEDFGTSSKDPVDYPDFAKRVSEAVLGGFDLGILVCGSGIGMSMSANKFPGVLAAFCMTPELAKAGREHNNANVLTLGARFTDEKTAKEIVKTFLETEFTDEERHARRVKKIGELESVFQARK